VQRVADYVFFVLDGMEKGMYGSCSANYETTEPQWNHEQEEVKIPCA